jgi:regulator of RNase E activity RraA
MMHADLRAFVREIAMRTVNRNMHVGKRACAAPWSGGHCCSGDFLKRSMLIIQTRTREASMSIGFRIVKRVRKVAPDLVAKFREIPVANVSDCMARITAGGCRLRPLHTGGVMAGPAFTVKTRPGDNLMLHKAIDMADPGDIIVVDGGGDLTNALMGELMLMHAAKRGIGGFVLDGSVRDLSYIRVNPMPVYAAGVTHRGPYKDGPGEINVPIAIDGMVIAPGDLVLGDEDGTLCVPFDAAESIYAAAKLKNDSEVQQIAEIKAGTSDRKWVDAALKARGCIIET